jgi:hypothetical protein
MRVRPPLRVLVVILAVLCGVSAPVCAQVTTQEGLTLSETIRRLTFSRLFVGPATQSAADIIEFGTAVEVASAPLGTSSGGFEFKLDPATGMQVRPVKTFGPTFGHRAKTSGEGKVSVGATFLYATYDKFGNLDIDQMRLLYSQQADNRASAGYTSLAITSKSLFISGLVGVTENLDVGVHVPLVSVKVEGVSLLCSGSPSTLFEGPECRSMNNVVVSRTSGGGVSSGIGDIAALVKYRFMKFGGETGGLAVLGTVRLPTGDRENLRGLGVSRTLVALVASWGKGKLKPHAHGGFEFWSDSVRVIGDPIKDSVVKVRNQLEYAAGLEFEAASKLTLLLDVLGRHTLGGGTMGFRTAAQSGSVLEYAVGLPKGNVKITLAPGLKANVKGKFLIALNALVPIYDEGLHDRFTPVASLEWNF